MDDHSPEESTSLTPKLRPTLPDQTFTFVPLQLVLVPTGMTVDLTKPEQVMGRHSTADIRLPLPDVSRKHCRFVFRHGSWSVIDLDSLNGVFVNGQRVPQAVLKACDQLRIGSFTFEVRFPDASTLRSPAGSDLRRAS